MKHLLNRSIIEQREKVADQLGAIDSEITARIDYILHFIYEAFGSKLGGWDYNGSSSQADGSFDPDMFLDDFNVWMNPYLPDEGVFLDKDKAEWGLNDSIPSRWLFEDFEEELTSGIANLKKFRADKKVQAAKRALIKAEEEKKFIDSIKEKLTPAELKVLLKKKNQKSLK